MDQCNGSDVVLNGLWSVGISLRTFDCVVLCVVCSALPYVGMVTILLNDYPKLKYILVLFVVFA